LLVAKAVLFANAVPTQPGGGTVAFVTPWSHTYIAEIETREDGGTPAILQSIRCGLAFRVQMALGVEAQMTSSARKCDKALSRWRAHPNLLLLGGTRSGYLDSPRLPIISFEVLLPAAIDHRSSAQPPQLPTEIRARVFTEAAHARRMLHPNFVATLLNDVYGIQSRSGCSSAGPYSTRLWDVDRPTVLRLEHLVVAHGMESVKLGWCRVNLCWMMTDEEADFDIRAVEQVATDGWRLLPLYSMHWQTGTWRHARVRICTRRVGPTPTVRRMPKIPGVYYESLS